MTRNQLWVDGEMCIYALLVSTMEPSNVKEAMPNLGWMDSMHDELLQFKRLDVLSMLIIQSCLQAEKGTLWVKASTDSMMILSLVLQTLGSANRKAPQEDADHTRCQDFFKITSGGTQFLEPGDDVAVHSDAVRSYKRRHQKSYDGVRM
ncbi:hypothetical protein Tco_0778983 [Tanacetum coccineum]